MQRIRITRMQGSKPLMQRDEGVTMLDPQRTHRMAERFFVIPALRAERWGGVGYEKGKPRGMAKLCQNENGIILFVVCFGAGTNLYVGADSVARAQEALRHAVEVPTQADLVRVVNEAKQIWLDPNPFAELWQCTLVDVAHCLVGK